MYVQVDEEPSSDTDVSVPVLLHSFERAQASR